MVDVFQKAEAEMKQMVIDSSEDFSNSRKNNVRNRLRLAGILLAFLAARKELNGLLWVLNHDDAHGCFLTSCKLMDFHINLWHSAC